MKADRSEFVVILDRSGSMETGKNDHEGGLKSFVEEQKKLPGDVKFTLIQFDSQNPFELVYDAVPIEKVGAIDLVPRGGTPLLDAVGRSLVHVADRLSKQADQPDLVVVMVITDGEENQSREYIKEKVKALITEREKAGWKVLYLGANVDAFAEAGGMGVHSAVAMNYVPTSIGIRGMYASVVSGAMCARMATQAGQSQNQALSGFAWTDEQRLAAIGKGSCTCIGTMNGDVNCPIHAKEVQLKQQLGSV